MNSVSETSAINPSCYTVLIVENVLADRELYSRCLQADFSCSYTLLEAQSVTSAVSICQNNRVDGILLNYMLPDAMGLKFVQELQTRFKGTHPPVVIVANDSDLSIAVRAIKEGVEDYLLKQTLTPEQLQLSMRSAIENTRLRLQLQQQQKQTEAGCKREEILKLFVKHIPAGVAMLDRQMRYVLVSDRWLTSYGIEGQEIIGRSHYELFPEISESWKKIHQRCLAGSVETCAEDIFVRADGSIDWVRWEIHPWQTNDDEIGGIIIFSEVINERKRNEQRLQESQEQLQLGVQVAGLALARVDYGNNTIELSQEAAALYGLSTEQLVVTRERIHATFHPEDQVMLAELIEQVLNPCGTGWFAQEHRVVWENGEVRWLNVRKQVFFERFGCTLRPSYAILAALDVTERKQAEAEREQLLVQAQAAHAEAQAANRSKDDFVAMVAHELRSPLNAIMGWTQLLQKSSLDAKTTNKALDVICRNTQVQVQLIEDLHDVSRMVRGTLQFNFALVNLINVVETAVETIRPASEAKSIQITTQIQGIAAIQIWGDFTRLQQVVLNLLTNSLKFTPVGGQVKILLAVQNFQIQIQVSDTGKGIRPEFLPHIFERFRQDQQNATVKQGLGLGLALVKYIVEQHGGTVTVQSQGEGQGSTFTVMLPLLQ